MSSKVLHTISNLLLSSSKNLNVDGASVSKTFSISVSTESHLTKFIILLKDDGSTSFSKFGAITALSNGLLFQIVVGGVTRTITTIKDNGDLCTRFPLNQFGNGAILSILSLATPEGFGGSNNIFMGLLELSYPITLNIGDSVQVVVQDDLTSIDFLQVAVKLSQD